MALHESLFLGSEWVGVRNLSHVLKEKERQDNDQIKSTTPASNTFFFEYKMLAMLEVKNFFNLRKGVRFAFS